STDTGAGWEGPPANFFTTLPGVAGGSFGPDIRVNNINPATVLQVFGGGTAGAGDQLYVDAPSEQPVTDPVTAASTFNTDPLGLNALGTPNNVPGVIVPGFGVGNAFDDIGVNLNAPQLAQSGNTLPALANGVTIINNNLGKLIPVQMGAVANFV